MNAPNENRWRRLLRACAEGMARRWPEESAPWGRAMAAEFSEAASASTAESARWLIGGAMLFAREKVRQFWKSLGRPVGVPPTGPIAAVARESRRVPRMPRVVTALLLAASAAILLWTDARTGFALVIESYSRHRWDAPKWGSVEKLRQEEAQTHDPQLAALLALLVDDSATRQRFAEQAIARDSSFEWLDYDALHWSIGRQDAVPEDRLQQLERWDPENAAVRLLRPQIMLGEMRKTAGAAANRPSDFERIAEANPEWVAAMHRAFTAPHYDNYLTQRFKLLQTASQKYGVNDPKLIGYTLASQPIPNLSDLKTFGDILIRRSKDAASKGDSEMALANAREALGFADTMTAGTSTPIERIIGSTIGQQAAARLQPLLVGTGRTDEAALVRGDAAKWNQSLLEQRHRGRAEGPVESATLGMHLSVVGISLFGCGVVGAVLLLWLRRDLTIEERGRSYAFASVIADISPIILLGCALTLYFFWHPYAQMIRYYLGAPNSTLPPTSAEELLWATWVATMVPDGIRRIAIVDAGQITYQGWFVLTAALSMLACFFVYRLVIKREASHE